MSKGDTLAIEYINLEGHLERYDGAMRELVRRRVDLIFALGQEDNLRAAMAATGTIPIVMLAIGYDPLTSGFVSSLARPTGNVTGIYVLSLEATKKRLQLFKDAFPALHAAFGFWDFDGAEAWRAVASAAPSLGIALTGIELRDPPYDYERALQEIAPEFRGALFLPASAVFTSDADRIAAFALRQRMISCLDASSRFVAAGGLMSYGADYVAAARRAAELADQIARGAKPADLPIEQSTRFKLRLNLKTAKILGVTLPAHRARHRRRGDRMRRREFIALVGGAARRGRSPLTRSNQHCRWSAISAAQRPMPGQTACRHSARG